MDATTTCPECGADDCVTSFHACLAADFSDERYGVVHHLVVAAYALQHRWYAPETTSGIVEFVLIHLDRPRTDHDRRAIRRTTDGAVRVQARQPLGPSRDWDRNVADVDMHSAERYVSTVRAYAGSVARALRDELGPGPASPEI